MFAADTLTVTSKITNVTVFFQGANVTRTAEVELKAGIQFVAIPALSKQLAQQTIQLGAAQGINVLSVAYTPHPTGRSKTKKSAEITTAETAFIELSERIIAADSDIELLDLEEKMLLANSDLTQKVNGATFSELRETVVFIRTRLAELRKQRVDLQTKRAELRRTLEVEHSALQLLKHREEMARQGAEVLLQVESKTATTTTLTLGYFVPSASWEPSYDFKVASTREPLTVVYKAAVSQSTGEDWNDVKLTLSAKNPRFDHALPIQEPWRLSRGYPYRMTSEVRVGAEKADVGTLRGMVRDAETGEPLAFVNVVLFRNGQEVTGVNTDFDGNYTIKPVEAGTYDVLFSYVGYDVRKFNKVAVVSNRLTYVDADLQSGFALDEVMIVECIAPLSNAASRVQREDLDRMPARSANNLPSSRIAEHPYYIDGIKVRGSSAFPVPATPNLRIVEDQVNGTRRRSATTMEYVIDQAHTVQSNGKDYILKVREVLVEAEYRFETVPIVDSEVFLTAHLANWEKLDLLPGDASIFIENVYTGKADLDLSQFKDTLSLAVGRDAGIQVRREENASIYSRRVFSSTVRETIGYTTTLRNAHNHPVRLVMYDQHPVETWKGFSIELVNTSGAEVDPVTGFMKWVIDLEPGEIRTVDFAYVMRAPL